VKWTIPKNRTSKYISRAIENIEGIGKVMSAALREKADIHSTKKLIDRTETAEDLRKVAELTDISEAQLTKFRSMCILLTVRGIGAEFSELLYLAGYKSIEDLASASPAALAAKCREANDIDGKRTRVKASLSEVRVSRWIESAKEKLRS